MFVVVVVVVVVLLLLFLVAVENLTSSNCIVFILLGVCWASSVFVLFCLG